MAPDLAARLKGQMVLAPLTRGGNLPFRRLCADFGMQVGMGEMIFARNLIKGDKIEAARLRRASNEQSFCVQIATNDVDEGRRAVESVAARARRGQATRGSRSRWCRGREPVRSRWRAVSSPMGSARPDDGAIIIGCEQQSQGSSAGSQTCLTPW